MVNEVATLGAAPAWMSVPQAKATAAAASGTTPHGSGKSSAPSGEELPVPRPPPAPPVFDVDRAVERLNELMSSRKRSLRFDVDAGSGRTVITVINASTNEIVRQIPPEELLQIAHNLEAFDSVIDALV
jgi:flagellar protein FlaG